MDSMTKKILIWGSSVIVALTLIVLILLVVSGVITGSVTYIVDGEVYAESTGSTVNNYSFPEDPEKEGYSFGGWFCDEKFEKPFELNKIGFLGLYFGNTKAYANLEKHVHSFESVEKTKATCTETGIKVKICKDKNCNYIQSTETVPAKGHTISDGKLVEHIKPDGTYRFSFEGRCSECREDFYTRNVSVTSKIKTPTSCQKDGVTEYSCKYEGKTYTTTVTEPKFEHTLNGKYVSNFMTYDGCIIYGTKNVYLNTPVSVAPECSDDALDAKFICEECNKAIDVKVKTPHKDTVTTLVAATCEDEGFEKRHCSACLRDETLAVPSLKHSENWFLTKSTDGKDFIINCECDREACGAQVYPPEKANKDYVTTTQLSYSTCSVNGKIMHVYNDADLDITLLDIAPLIPHILDGKSVDRITNSKGEFKYGTEGLKLFSGAKAPACGTKSDKYYYECDFCEGIVRATVVRDHQYTKSVGIVPTCDKDGTVKYTCSVCKYSYEETVEKLDHVAIFSDNQRKVVFKQDSEGYFYSDQDGISLPDGYTPKNGDKVEGYYVCKSCGEFMTVDVIVRVRDAK